MKAKFQELQKSPAFRVFKSLWGLILLFAAFSILSPVFCTLNNILTVTLQMAIYALLALGIAYVLIVGGAELSAGSIVGVTGMIFVLALQAEINVFIAGVLALLVGMLCGFCNGFMVTKMKMIPFIATLGMQYIARGVTQLLSRGSSISLRTAVTDPGVYKALTFIGSGKVFTYIPMATVLVLVFYLIHRIVLNRTSFGRKVYAVGSNREAARLSGIDADKITIGAYLVSAVMATFAGLLLVMRVTTAQSTGGTGYEFEGIAASVIGGISMMGGEGNVTGCLIGAAMLAVMRNGLNLLGINTFWQNIVTGVVIIAAVYLDIRRRTKEAENV